MTGEIQIAVKPSPVIRLKNNHVVENSSTHAGDIVEMADNSLPSTTAVNTVVDVARSGDRFIDTAKPVGYNLVY